VLPSTTAEVARVLAWCYDHDVPVVPRGGGTGFAGGAVPLDGGVVLGLERLARVRAFEPLLWRMWVEAGVTTARVRRLALEYLDAATLAAAGRSLPVDPPGGARFLVLAEVDGSAEEVERLRAELVAVLAEGAVAVHAPSEAATIAELWRWRAGVSIAVTAQLGGRSPRTSSSRSTASARRASTRLRSASATGCRRAAGAVPATATCIRRSSSRRTTSTGLRVPRTQRGRSSS
jgi:hypothetical protein